jgi:predicted O-methyltransferase YrrM
MVQKFKVAFNYLKHQSMAFNRHGIHSPFVYDFLEQVLYTDNETNELKQLSIVRNQLLSDTRKVEITDLGAGSTINNSKIRLVKDIAKNSSKHPKYGRLFYRMIAYFKPRNVIELGTSLGLSTIYFAKANPKLNVYTLEGCPNTLKVAQENFNNLNLANIITAQGDFKDTLPKVLNTISTADFIFFDGNHQEQATLDYFNAALPFKNENSVFIFDDIHWSDGMTNAWNKIKGHPETVVTLDLFFLGIVFFKSGLTKQDFKIRF